MSEAINVQDLDYAWSRQVASGLSVSLVAYRRAERQPPHCHTGAQLTIQLAGALDEQQEGRDYSARSAAIGFKPAGMVHSDRWGNAGTLLFTVEARGAASETLLTGIQPGWRRARSAHVLASLVGRLADNSPDEMIDTLTDIVELCYAATG